MNLVEKSGTIRCELDRLKNELSSKNTEINLLRQMVMELKNSNVRLINENLQIKRGARTAQ